MAQKFLNGIASTGNILPSADSTYDLGHGSYRWANLNVDAISTTSSFVSGGTIALQSNISTLNKAQTAYIGFATRNVSGSETLMDLSNVGTINGVTLTDFVSKANGGTFAGTIAASNLSGTNTGDQTLPTTLPATTSDTLDFFQDSSGVSLHQFNNSLDDVGGNYNATSTGATYGTGLDTRFGSHGINTQGDGTYVDIAGLPTIQAVSIWYKAIGNDNGYIVDFRHDTPSNARSYLYTLAGSDQYINMGNDTTTTNTTGDIWINGVAFTSGQYNFTSGNWYHIVLTTDAVSTAQTWDQGIRIGNRSDGSTNGNAGYFDQVRTFNRRLTSSDVALLYAEVETGATADQTAGEILSLIKTVDGASSGLDADLLDGVQGDQFLRSTTASGTPGPGNANTTISIGDSGTSYAYVQSHGSKPLKLNPSGNAVHVGANRILTTADEGTGNGLDADTLDGNEASAFALSSIVNQTDFVSAASGGTFNGDVIINSAGDAASPVLRLNNSSSSPFNHALEALNANLTTTETELLLVGKSANSRNSGYIGFNWVADDSNSNYVSIGHWGYNHLLKIYPTGNSVFSGSVTSSSGTSQFSVVNASAYQLNGTYIVDSSRNLVNISQLRFGGSDALIDTASVTSATATTDVASVVHATYTAAFFDFVIKNGTNVRAGVVYACHDGTTVSFTETSTVDLGDTSDVTLSVVIDGTNMVLRATTTSSTWTIKSLIRTI